MPAAAASNWTVKLLLIILSSFQACQSQDTPMMFVFGDSFVDAGNNNYLNTTAHANHFPYGVNFDNRVATGRWSDGKIIPDFLASYLGVAYPPCFLGLARNVTNGANFGSAGSGILNITHIGGQVLTFTDQVNLFGEYRRRLDRLVGRRIGLYLTSRSIFYISIGNNDVNDYVNDHNMTITDTFRNHLLLELQEKIQTLYVLGARKLILASAYPLGCAPLHQSQGRCNPARLGAARYYNEGLFELAIGLPTILTSLNIVYASMDRIMMEVLQAPVAYGFRNVTHPCCPTTQRLSNPWCIATDSYCRTPSTYLYWDTAHPSDAFNEFAASILWRGSPRYIYPRNVQTLAQL